MFLLDRHKFKIVQDQHYKGLNFGWTPRMIKSEIWGSKTWGTQTLRIAKFQGRSFDEAMVVTPQFSSLVAPTDLLFFFLGFQYKENSTRGKSPPGRTCGGSKEKGEKESNKNERTTEPYHWTSNDFSAATSFSNERKQSLLANIELHVNVI